MKPRALISFGKLAVALALTLTSNILLPDTSWAQIGVFASVEGLQCSSTDVSFPGAIIVRSLSGGVSAGSGGGGGGSGGQPFLHLFLHLLRSLKILISALRYFLERRWSVKHLRA